MALRYVFTNQTSYFNIILDKCSGYIAGVTVTSVLLMAIISIILVICLRNWCRPLDDDEDDDTEETSNDGMTPNGMYGTDTKYAVKVNDEQAVVYNVRHHAKRSPKRVPAYSFTAPTLGGYETKTSAESSH